MTLDASFFCFGSSLRLPCAFAHVLPVVCQLPLQMMCVSRLINDCSVTVATAVTSSVSSSRVNL